MGHKCLAGFLDSTFQPNCRKVDIEMTITQYFSLRRVSSLLDGIHTVRD